MVNRKDKESDGDYCLVFHNVSLKDVFWTGTCV